MRVITGKYKGRNLVAPRGEARPTLDRMKETLFNIIAPHISSANVIDLFAGSGQLAIECLSRGAAHALLCDNSRDSVAAVKANFEKIGERADIFFGDFRDCLARQGKESADIVFVDPPYRSNYYDEVLQIVSDRDILSPAGIVVCEHSAEDELPQERGNLVLFDCRKMGTVKFSFYRRCDQ